MLPDRVSNPGPLTYESGALTIALRGPAPCIEKVEIHCIMTWLYPPGYGVTKYTDFFSLKKMEKECTHLLEDSTFCPKKKQVRPKYENRSKNQFCSEIFSPILLPFYIC